MPHLLERAPVIAEVGRLDTVELVRAARNGDDTAFVLLIQENLAGLRAVAIARLGYVDEVEDVVQDAVLVALRRLPELRDPAAVGAWLRSIVRNNCRMLLRSRWAVPVAEPEPLLPVDDGLDPGEILDRAASRDWLRHAVATLPEPVREVTVLRYFTSQSSYRQIAELCAVSEHAVRSRLRDGRRALRLALHDTASLAHADARVAVAASRHEAEVMIDSSLGGDYDRTIRDRFHPDAALIVNGHAAGGSSALLPMMDYTYGAGVRILLRNTAASRDLMIWETDFVNPPEAPEHCPPAMVWLHTLREGRIQRLRIVYRSTPVD
jgi:RNA polymerase sigma-70 factor (ECF subfamily)